MKHTINLFTVALLALTLLMATAVHAAKDPSPVKQSAALSINTNVVYLIIAGLIISIIAVRKSKQAEAYFR